MLKTVNTHHKRTLKELREIIINIAGSNAHLENRRLYDGNEKTPQEIMDYFSIHTRYLREHNPQLAEKVSLFTINFSNGEVCDKQYKDVLTAIDLYDATIVGVD